MTFAEQVLTSLEGSLIVVVVHEQLLEQDADVSGERHLRLEFR